MFKKLCALLIVVVSIANQAKGQTSVSQLTVTANDTATQLAQAIAGSGVIVSSASLNCGGAGYVGSGTFSYPVSATDLGLTNGIVLTNGRASDAASFAQIVSIQTANNLSDSNLTAICTQAIYDVCILQFDIIPMGDTMSIKYVFGSSEYDGYQCSTYNDAFGFFLTGANPAGGNYNGQNIATLLSGIPVSINTVNNGAVPYCTAASNPSFYRDNSSGTDVVYEGLTIPITSVIPVVPSSSYHIKIAIADASDELYDSGVFIQDGISSNQTGTTNIHKLNKQDNTLIVYPNPANMIINIELKMKDVNNTQYTIYDINGRAVKQSIIYNSQSLIDISDLTEGVYNISMSNNEGVINKRLVIVR